MYENAEEHGSLKSAYAAADVELTASPLAEFWRLAEPVFAGNDEYGRTVPGHRSAIVSRWTEAYLYLLFACPYEELYLNPRPDTVHETYGLWNWDVAELFIGADFQNIRRYKEFEVSPQGEWIDLDVNLDLPDHTVGWTWSSGFQPAPRIDEEAKTWFAAMKIPFASIAEEPPVPEREFRVNLFRSQGPPERRKRIAWKAPMTASFHTPERFGRLILVDHP